MQHTSADLSALQATITPDIVLDSTLESTVALVEQRLAALSDALRLRDAAAVEAQADALHRALAQAVASVVHANRHGGVPQPMRLRLRDASAQVARQRESLARATASLDRAIDLLMPDAQPAAGRALYAASGRSASPRRGGGTLSA